MDCCWLPRAVYSPDEERKSASAIGFAGRTARSQAVAGNRERRSVATAGREQAWSCVDVRWSERQIQHRQRRLWIPARGRIDLELGCAFGL